MKNSFSKLAIAKTVIVSFENSNQEKNIGTNTSWICSFFKP